MNILDEYIASTCMIPPNEFRQDEVLTLDFEHMANSIVKGIIERKKELPNEDCLFVLTCKIYKWKEYMEAHPDVFKKEVDK